METSLQPKRIRMAALCATSLVFLAVCSLAPAGAAAQGLATSSSTFSPVPERKLDVPKTGTIRVAFVVSPMTTLIDVAGPMQTFNQVSTAPDNAHFETFTVSAAREPTSSQGLTVVPDYTFENAPDADIVVLPAQSWGVPMGSHDIAGAKKYLDYVKRMASEGKLLMSVCTGVSVLARTGLLDGAYATSHHDFIDGFQKRFASTHWLKDKAWVHSAPRIYTAGGETSGFELALHIVELYFGHKVAVETARSMEYRGPAWQA
jgi:transcriptional regulator GlxA family with amidase domain